MNSQTIHIHTKYVHFAIMIFHEECKTRIRIMRTFAKMLEYARILKPETRTSLRPVIERI